VPEVV
jgi:hypothetical protein